MDSGDTLLIINIEDAIGKDLYLREVAQLLSQFSRPLDARDEGGGVGHDIVVGYHIGGWS